MAPTRVILMSCGSYNPPTNMHLRMFEIARDHLHRMGTHVVVGAVISPTHDNYAKKELASSEHRCAMLKLATQNSDWIRVSTWETRQNGWTKTRLSLQHHQNLLNSILLNANDTNCRVELEDTDWVPENVRNSGDRTPIQIKLLCGADLLESFGTPGLWADEDIDAIVGQHGLVVITREGSNPNKFIYDSDILSKYMHNIYIVTEWIPNEVSSTKIRRALKRGESVRYLVQDSVIDYVYKHGIYDAKTVSTIKLELSTTNANDYLCIQPKYENAFLTPSPSDVTMTTPSPVEIISIDINETILKRNYLNSPSNGRENFSRDDNEDLREKFNVVTSDNGNKSVAQNRVSYPGLAKQIIANESGESKIFCEVGLSCISENYKVEMEIDGKTGHYEDNEDSSSKDIDRSLEITEINDDGTIDNYGQSENTPTPDDSEGKISVILSIDVIDSSNIDFARRSSKQDIASVILAPIENKEDILENEEVAESTEEETPINVDESINIDDKSTIDEDKSKTESKEAKIPINIESIDESRDSPIEDQCIDSSIDKIVDETKIEDPGNSDVDQDSISEELIDKRDGAIEIDGKYIKSVVNSRKSPKKLKNEENEGSSVETQNIEISKIDTIESTEKSIENDPDESSIAATPFCRTESIRKSIKTSGRRRGVVFQGSLDSINVNEDKSTIVTSDKKISKKSKSYEFIKTTFNQPTTIYKIPLNDADFSKDENSSINAVDPSVIKDQEAEINEVTDDFCSVCCYPNDPSTNESLCNARLTGSSPIEEPICEICSKSDLQEETSKNAFESIEFKPGEPVCELCEICGDAAMDEDVVASSRPEKDEFVDRRILGSRPLPLSLPKRKKVRLNTRSLENVDSDDYEDEDDVDHFEIDDNGANRRIIDTRDKLKYLGEKKSIEERTSDDTNSNDDEFEIENCGLDVADGAKNFASRYKNAIDDKLRNIAPENEIVNEKITRTSSLVNRETNDSGRFKRRYSSVDNLPNSRTIVKTSGAEKPNSLKSRAIKGLVSSADNIRPVRNSRSRTLRKSADDVTRGYQSSLDDTRELPLYENIGRKKMASKDEQQHKPRDSGTIKMILTKHGIKIISDKETAL